MALWYNSTLNAVKGLKMALVRSGRVSRCRLWSVWWCLCLWCGVCGCLCGSSGGLLVSGAVWCGCGLFCGSVGLLVCCGGVVLSVGLVLGLLCGLWLCLSLWWSGLLCGCLLWSGLVVWCFWWSSLLVSGLLVVLGLV